jgi:hypothetical protein
MSWWGKVAGALRRGEATEAEPEERPALGGRGRGRGRLGGVKRRAGKPALRGDSSRRSFI